jgi:hypothetical protein
MTDAALQEENIEGFIIKLDNHQNEVVNEKHQKVAERACGFNKRINTAI